MIPLYICDDDEQMLNNLKNMIENIIIIHNLDMQIVLAANNPYVLLEHKKNQPKRSIYFLDVDLKDDNYDGFSLGKELRLLDTRGFIIYVTTHEELIFETFKYRLEAMSYLVKDNIDTLREQTKECLMEINKLITQEESGQKCYYSIKVGDISHQIAVDDILFFETAAPHRLLVHTSDSIIEFRGDMRKLEKEMGSGFIRTHQSYLVQLNKIQEILYTNNTVTLKNGSVCLLSKSGKKLLKAAMDTKNEESK